MDVWNTLFLLPQFQERPQVEIVCWTVIKLHFKGMRYKNICSSCPKGAWRRLWLWWIGMPMSVLTGHQVGMKQMKLSFV